jgi:hypothetical protein
MSQELMQAFAWQWGERRHLAWFKAAKAPPKESW